MHSRKGTDKPIEIFIALFIILAIAMLMLRMFADQLREKTDELKRQEYQQKLDQARKEAEQSCSTACTKTLENQCSTKALAEYCMTRVKGGLDLNVDNDKEDYVRPKDAAILVSGGTCESHVYCREIRPCNECQYTLNLENCIKLTCNWMKQERPGADIAIDVLDLYETGKCLNDQQKLAADNARETWDAMILPLIDCYCNGNNNACNCLSGAAPCPVY